MVELLIIPWLRLSSDFIGPQVFSVGIREFYRLESRRIATLAGCLPRDGSPGSTTTKFHLMTASEQGSTPSRRDAAKADCLSGKSGKIF
jgi:hypothetical protein